MEVHRQLSLLQKDVACANGRAIVQMVTSWRRVWLAQSCLPAALQSTFAHHPRANFGPRVDDIIEQTDKVRGDLEALRQFMLPLQALGPRQTDCRHIPAPEQRWGPSPAPSPRAKGRQQRGAQCEVKQQPVFPTRVFPPGFGHLILPQLLSSGAGGICPNLPRLELMLFP